jgi:hypothetical protein
MEEHWMKRIFWLLCGTVLGASGMWTSMNYHVLRTKDGITFVPKYQARLDSTFVDVRAWGVTEWTEHPELVLTLQKNDRTDIIGDAQVFGTTLREAMNFVK